MTRDGVEAKLRPIIVTQLGVEEEQVTLEATFVEDLKADSLEMVDFIIEIEEKFEVSVADEEAEAVKTVKDAIDLLCTKLGIEED